MPRPWRLRLVLGLALAVVATGLGAYFWVASYRPFGTVDGSGPRAGIDRTVDPATGSGGKIVYFVRRGSEGATVELDILASPRWGVRLVGIDTDAPSGAGLAPTAIAGWAYEAIPTPRPFRAFRLRSWNRLLVHFRASCRFMGPGTATSIDRLTLRYRYLHRFERSQTVELPAALTLRC